MKFEMSSYFFRGFLPLFFFFFFHIFPHILSEVIMTHFFAASYFRDVGSVINVGVFFLLFSFLSPLV